MRASSSDNIIYLCIDINWIRAGVSIRRNINSKCEKIVMETEVHTISRNIYFVHKLKGNNMYNKRKLIWNMHSQWRIQTDGTHGWNQTGFASEITLKMSANENLADKKSEKKRERKKWKQETNMCNCLQQWQALCAYMRCAY